MLLGALGGGLVGLVLTLLAPGAGQLVLLTMIGVLGLLGLLTGAVVAIALDALSVRRRR